MLDTTRREFIALIGGGSLLLAVKVKRARGQPAMPLVGFLGSASPEVYADRIRAFRQGLKEAGYVEGQNVNIEYRSARACGTFRRGASSRTCNCRRHVCGTGGEGGDGDCSNRIRNRGRPGADWARREPEPAGRQRDRRHKHKRRTGPEAAGADA